MGVTELNRRPRRAARATVALVSAACLAAGLAAPAGALVGPDPFDGGGEPLPETVTADALPTPQVDGVVFSIAVVGDVVWAGGDFGSARPAGAAPGEQEVRRDNLLAFDAQTGELLPMAPRLEAAPEPDDGDVFCRERTAGQQVCDAVFRVEASADDGRLYVSGDFQTVDGVVREGLAALDPSTGALVEDFRPPALDGRVRALAVGGDAVYVGGDFTSAGTTARRRLAAVDLDGGLLPFDPGADREVWAAALSDDESRLVVGGPFDRVAGRAQHGLSAVLTADGGPARWDSDRVPDTGETGSWVSDLEVVGDVVYAGGIGQGGTPSFNGRLKAVVETGEVLWYDDCAGDTQSVAVMGDVLYSASHAHECDVLDAFPENRPTYQRLLAQTTDERRTNRYGDQVPALLPWFADTDGGPAEPFDNGPWAVTAAGDQLFVGGEFFTANPGGSNTVASQGLTRFRLPASAPNRTRPEFPFTVPEVRSPEAGQVHVRWRSTWDRDSLSITYQVLRDGRLVHVETHDDVFWQPTWRTWVDRDLVPGAMHTYQVRALDADGNALGSPSTAPVVVSDQAPVDQYARVVAEDAAVHHWRLGEAAGATTFDDEIGETDLVVPQPGDPVAGVPGALAGSDDTALRLPGTAGAWARQASSTAAGEWQHMSAEVWLRVEPGGRGPLLGHADRDTGDGPMDRSLYVADDGTLRAVVRADTPRVGAGVIERTNVVSSTARVDDGRWHHAVLTLSTAGQELYLDGERVARNPLVTAGDPRDDTSWWTLGRGAPSRLPGLSQAQLDGDVDEVALYRSVLTPEQVAQHHAVARAQRDEIAPTAALDVRCEGLTCTFDASGSGDADGTVVGYRFDPGDGSPAVESTGPRTTGTYAVAGTYRATLTVTDDDGLTATAGRSVTVAAPVVRDLLTDDFGRTVDRGWGEASDPAAGTWSSRWRAGDFSVDGDHGLVRLPRPGVTRSAWLDDVVVDDGEVQVSFGLGSSPRPGAEVLLSLQPRRVDHDLDYRARLRVLDDGSARLGLAYRDGGGVDRLLVEVGVEGLVVDEAGRYVVRVRASGTAPTVLEAKAWDSRDPEPGWQVRAVDATPGLQVPGSPGISAERSDARGGASSGAVTVRVDDLLVDRG